MKKVDKLSAHWSKKENDHMINWPVGVQTKADAWYLHGIFSKEFKEELERRGYDLKTLKFSIEPQQGNPRFASQRKPE